MDNSSRAVETAWVSKSIRSHPSLEQQMSITKSARTRNRVIEGALRALCSSGVLATTTRKIAAESNVHLATLHYHFQSKGALLLAVFEHLISEITATYRVETKGSTDVTTCIEHVLKAAWRFLMRTRDLQIVQYELTLYALREDAQWLAVHQYDSYVNVYRDILLDVAKRTGELDTGGCTALARFILAGIDGLLLQELAKPNRARSMKGLEALIKSAQQYALALRKDTTHRHATHHEAAE
jgi:AcrR family transcriptional regulator